MAILFSPTTPIPQSYFENQMLDEGKLAQLCARADEMWRHWYPRFIYTTIIMSNYIIVSIFSLSSFFFLQINNTFMKAGV